MDETLVQHIWRIIQEDPAYGIRKVWAVLKYRLGILVNHKNGWGICRS